MGTHNLFSLKVARPIPMALFLLTIPISLCVVAASNYYCRKRGGETVENNRSGRHMYKKIPSEETVMV